MRNLRLVTEAEFEHLKALDEAGRGRQLANLLGLSEPDHTEMRNWFLHRFLTLALEAYRREEISRGKFLELALMVGLTESQLDQLIYESGIEDNISASEYGA